MVCRFDIFSAYTNFIKTITEMFKFVTSEVICNDLTQEGVPLKALDHAGCKCLKFLKTLMEGALII